MKTLLCTLLMMAIAMPLAADRDFLTTDEADQIRLAQEPNERLIIYAGIARERVEMIESLLKKEKTGRSSLIHETLEDYTKIIETIDVVADDALSREVDITEGLSAVAEAEEEFLSVLGKIEEGKPKDVARFRFVLETAIEATSDSLETNLEDLGDRRMQVTDRMKRERKNLESMMTPEMASDREADTAPMKEKEEEEKKAAPSLFKTGEKEKLQEEQKELERQQQERRKKP